MKTLTTMIAALALGTISYAADEPAKPAPAPGAPHAADKKPHHSPEEAFKKLDTDKSGDISLAEFKASPRGQKDAVKAEEHYKKLDGNSDGKVTLEEFTAGHHEKKAK